MVTHPRAPVTNRLVIIIVSVTIALLVKTVKSVYLYSTIENGDAHRVVQPTHVKVRNLCDS